MRKYIIAAIALAAALILVVGAGQNAARPNFSGVWNLDLQKSKLQIPAPDSGVFNIGHKEPSFHLSRTFIKGGENDTWSIDLTTDGKEVVQAGQTEIFRGRLRWEGNDLILDSTISVKDRTATNVVRYHLSDDGQVLTATENFKGPRLKYENTWVFDKNKLGGPPVLPIERKNNDTLQAGPRLCLEGPSDPHQVRAAAKLDRRSPAYVVQKA